MHAYIFPVHKVIIKFSISLLPYFILKWYKSIMTLKSYHIHSIQILYDSIALRSMFTEQSSRCMYVCSACACVCVM